MELTTLRRLADLNRAFYEQHAEAFAESRPRLAPGIARVLALIPAGAAVLEVGCGDGKVARALRARPGAGPYVGLDLSPAMLARARRLTAEALERPAAAVQPSAATHLGAAAFALADLTAPGWARALPPAPFDWILAFAVFHHLPGSTARARVCADLAQHLSPGGWFVMSNWQFMRSARLRLRVLPWSALDLRDTDVEPGDYLLSWERAGRHGMRYVHVLDEAEVRRMAAGAGLRVVEQFRSDGVTGELADYVLMRREPGL